MKLGPENKIIKQQNSFKNLFAIKKLNIRYKLKQLT